MLTSGGLASRAVALQAALDTARGEVAALRATLSQIERQREQRLDRVLIRLVTDRVATWRAGQADSPAEPGRRWSQEFLPLVKA